MKERKRSNGRLTAVFVMVGLASTLAGSSAILAAEPLALRVQDAIGEPGGLIAFVLRTYASRPIGQGQICLIAQPTTPDSGVDGNSAPLGSFEGSVVFSDAGDARVDLFAEMAQDPQTIVLAFTSESATVNRSDGPLAVLFFRLDEAVAPGSTFEVVIDQENTVLFDENGSPVDIEVRAGQLTTRLPADPYLLAADGTRIQGGEVADLGLTTSEPYPIFSGQAGFRYDPSVASGPPVVRMDPRHGQASFEVDTPWPGLVIVSFESPGGSLNQVPGKLIEIDLPTTARSQSKAATRVWLEPALTYVAGAQGQLAQLTLEDDVLEFSDWQFSGSGRASRPIEIAQDGLAEPAARAPRQPERPRRAEAKRSRHGTR